MITSVFDDFFLVFENGPDGPRIWMKKYHPKIEDGINILLKRFDFQNYHHYCFLFTSKAQFPYPGGYVNLTNKAYIDGNLVNEGKSLITKVKFFIFTQKLCFF